MAWTAPRTWVALEDVTAALFNTHIRDNFKAIGDAWASYTPAWTAATTNPVIGNGTITGKYVEVGKRIDFRVIITMGSTTTFGSGQYAVSLPVATHGTGLQLALADAFIGGVAHRLHARITAGGSSLLLYCEPTTAGNALRSVTPTTPGTFANGNIITITGTYEAA